MDNHTAMAFGRRRAGTWDKPHRKLRTAAARGVRVTEHDEVVAALREADADEDKPEVLIEE